MAKIMLVEDDRNLSTIYSDRLTAEGYEVVAAHDGEEALAMAVKEKPDLIISDVMMPKISGFDMLDILRSTPETKDTKVIMMTALSQAQDQDRADKLGADRYLVKSQVTLDDVAKAVNEIIQQPKAPSPSANTEQPAVPPASTPPLTQQVVPMPMTAAPGVTPDPAPSDPVLTQQPPQDPVPSTDTPEPTAQPTPAPTSPFPAPDPSAVSAPAQPTEAEQAEVAAQIDKIVSGAPKTAPATENSTPTSSPQEQDEKTTPEPAPEKEAETTEGSTRLSERVIQPLHAPGEEPNIYQLYEKEMAEEAANAAVPTPPAGVVIKGQPSAAPDPSPALKPAESVEDTEILQKLGITNTDPTQATPPAPSPATPPVNLPAPANPAAPGTPPPQDEDHFDEHSAIAL